VVDYGPVKRTADGVFLIDLSDEERTMLRSLPGQLRDLLDTNDPAIARLFPPAYSDDPEREDEYRRLMKDELLSRRLEALALLEETAGADRLTEEQLLVWMRVINDLRLVVGTMLDVKEDDDPDTIDPDDPQAPMRVLYWYLSALLQSIIEALES
jgi:hypothetical protein